jgi:hypothetical protein
MEIKVSNNIVDITGNIKSLDDYSLIKDSLTKIISSGEKEIVVNVRDSLSMVSSVIGYLIKIINTDGISVQVNVWDKRLYNLLDQLSLIDLFKVKMN